MLPIATTHSLQNRCCGWIASLLLGLVAMTWAQPSPPASPANFDPSDVYFQGYLASRRAEQMLESGEAIRATEQFRKAEELFESVRKFYPQWRSEMVNRRSAKNTSALEEAEKLAQQQLDNRRSVVAELEGGIRVSGSDIDEAGIAEPPGILKVDPIASRRLDDAHKEVERLRELVRQQQAEKQRLQTLMADQSATSDAKLEEIRRMSEEERTKTTNEIRRLRTEALVEKSRAEAKIKKLEELTGQTKKQAEDKIKQLEELAASATENAHKEVRRMQNLSGQEKQQAEKEIKRLQQLAAKAHSDAQHQVDQLKTLTKESQLDANKELQKVREQAIRAQAEADAHQIELDMINSRNIARINELTRKTKDLQSRLEAAETNADALRSRMASAPVIGEVKQLNNRIHRLEQERDAMSYTLRQTQSGYNDAMNKISGIEQELLKARQQTADINRDLKAERKSANEVVAGQRRQLKALRDQLDEKSRQLANAQEEIGNLKRELQESNDAFNQLREEHNALLVERDTYKSMLSLNEASRIQDLIDQNMSLAKKLRESSEELDRLKSNSNEDKDAITDALRDLAIAKRQIISLQQEKRDQNLRLAEMEARLQSEQQALSNGEASADPVEIALLRDIIKRQLTVQKRRKQASQLLLEAAKGMGSQDPELAEAMKLMEEQEVTLTPEEQKLLANREVDGEFVSPFARSRDDVNLATNALNSDIAVFERTARKSFLAERYLPTRELYEMILELNPGHTPTLCKLGLVHLKLRDYDAASDSFRRAVELDNKNAYGLRMLGLSLMRSGQMDQAEQAVRESVKLDPNDDKSHILLASLCANNGNTKEAESHFKAATTVNPTASEPYYNLAVLYQSIGKQELARKFYRDALERGALPDPQLEKLIKTP